jgi:prepilin-type processing-associated H-X9-DG protein
MKIAWRDGMEPYTGVNPKKIREWKKQTPKDSGIYYCPADDWFGPNNAACYSYGYNPYMVGFNFDGGYGPFLQPAVFAVKVEQVSTPSKKIYIADNYHPSLYSMVLDQNCWPFWKTSTPAGNRINKGLWFRHVNKANFLNVDGHVSTNGVNFYLNTLNKYFHGKYNNVYKM